MDPLFAGSLDDLGTADPFFFTKSPEFCFTRNASVMKILSLGPYMVKFLYSAVKFKMLDNFWILSLSGRGIAVKKNEVYFDYSR